MGRSVRFKPQPKQYEAIKYLRDNKTRQILIGGGAGGGKTFLASFEGINSCVKYPESISIIGGAELKKLKQTVMPTFLDVCKDVYGMAQNIDYRLNMNDGIVKFLHSGSTMFLKELAYRPSDPNYSYIRGFTPTWGYIDEVDGITQEAKDEFRLRIRYKHDKYNIKMSKILMSCNPSQGWLKEEFYKPWRDGTLPEDKQFVQSLAYDNKFLSPDYIRALEEAPVAKRKIYLEGDWDFAVDDEALMDPVAVDKLFTNQIEPNIYDKWISVDVAGKGADKTVAYVFYGLKLMEYVVIDKNDAQEFVDLVNRLIAKHAVCNTRTVIDSDGLGFVSGMIHGCYQFIANHRPIDTEVMNSRIFKNKKAQCYFRLRSLIEAGALDMSIMEGEDREQLRQELCAIRQGAISKDSPLQIEPKEKTKQRIKRSPDYADALAMGMVFQLEDYVEMDSLLNYGFDIT